MAAADVAQVVPPGTAGDVRAWRVGQRRLVIWQLRQSVLVIAERQWSQLHELQPEPVDWSPVPGMLCTIAVQIDPGWCMDVRMSYA